MLKQVRAIEASLFEEVRCQYLYEKVSKQMVSSTDSCEM